jgi:hypothetical protein
MTTDPITLAVRSVLGDYVSPEKAHAVAAALRPIHGREAADIANDSRPTNNEDDFDTGGHTIADLIVDNITSAFGVTDNDH